LENAPSSSKETHLIIRNLSNVLKDKCSENGERLSILEFILAGVIAGFVSYKQG
jgi:hypothetical protein